MLSKEWLSLNAYDRELLGKPSVITENCAVCGRPATNKHHVVFKGLGGVSDDLERLIPKIKLCGHGNIDGCHGLVHQKRMFFRWRDGWQYRVTGEPTKLDAAMWEPDAEWRRLPGWEAMREIEG